MYYTLFVDLAVLETLNLVDNQLLLSLVTKLVIIDFGDR